MNLIAKFKELSKKANIIGIDSHIHMTVGAALCYGIFTYTGIYWLAICLPLVVGAAKEAFIDKNFNIKDMFDYVYGAGLVLIGTTIT